VLSGVAVLLVAAILGLVFAVRAAKPAKTDNGSRPEVRRYRYHYHDRPRGQSSTPGAGTQAPAETIRPLLRPVVTAVQAG